MRYCYIIFHIVHDMYSNEYHSFIEGVYESKDDAVQHCEELNQVDPDSYYVEVSEYYEKEG